MLDNDSLVIVQLHSIAIEGYHLVRWHDEDLVSVVPDTNVTRIEGAEADDDCLVKWGKRYCAEIVASVQKTEAGIVAAINDLKEALLVKLDAFARPSWSARTPWDDSASPVPRTSAADQEASTLAFQQPPSMPQPPINASATINTSATTTEQTIYITMHLKW
ncbi:hypothetical protein EMCRGX_G001782 [Ephydatia muelleri]